MKTTKVIVPIILVLVGLGAGFFGGYQYRNYLLRRAAGITGANGSFQRFARNGQGNVNGAFRGGAVIGSILSISGNIMTVKLADGSSKNIVLSSSTTYSNTAPAQESDLKVGSNVAVFGTTNSDGSVTATSVQINPEQFQRGAFPFASPAANP
jgi:hypothetical protein